MSSPLGQWVRCTSLRSFTCSLQGACRAGQRVRKRRNPETDSGSLGTQSRGRELKQKRCNSHLCDIYFDCLHQTEGKAQEAGISGKDQNPNPLEGPG